MLTTDYIAQRKKATCFLSHWTILLVLLIIAHKPYLNKDCPCGSDGRGSDGKASASTMRETWVRSLGQEEPLEKEMALHSTTTAWKISWTEEPGRPQSMGLQRVRHDWATSLHLTQWIFRCLKFWNSYFKKNWKDDEWYAHKFKNKHNFLFNKTTMPRLLLLRWFIMYITSDIYFPGF